MISMLKRRALAVLLMLLAHGLPIITCLSASAGYPPMVPLLQPYQVVSSEGTWQLDVKPGNREGSGAALTTLTNKKTGIVAWKQMLPYTFWQCCVNENGAIGGYAYSKGVMVGGQWEGTKEPGEFLICFLNVEGSTIHQETSRRSPSSVGMGYYQPTHCAHRLLFDAENDRMIVQMDSGALRFYDLESGTMISVFAPTIWPDEIRFIPETSLMLFEKNSAWHTGNAKGTYESESKSSLQLIDEQGSVLWEVKHSQTFAGEFKGAFPEFRILDTSPEPKQEVDPDPVAPDNPFDEPDPFAENPFDESDPFAEADSKPEEENPPEIIAPVLPEIASFEVYLGNTGEKVTVQILKDEDSDRNELYKIVEKSREKWTPPVEIQKPDADTPPVDFPIVETPLQSSFQLKRQDGVALTEIAAVAIGPEDTIHALDRASDQVHVFDRNGKTMHSCNFGKKYAVSKTLAVNEQGEVFVEISEEPNPAADKLDSLVGRCLRFSAKGILDEKTVGPFGSGLIAQAKTSGMISIRDKEIVLDILEGDNSWNVATIAHRADGQWLDCIENIACAADGSIAVRDTSSGNSYGGFTTPYTLQKSHLPAETITIYEPDGKPIRTIDFSLYPGLTNIAFDDRHILATYPNFPPTPLVYVFTATGKPVGAIQIKELENNKSLDLRAFISGDGKEILAIDLSSGMVFRYTMP